LRYYDHKSDYYDHAHPKKPPIIYEQFDRSLRRVISRFPKLENRYLRKAVHMGNIFQTKTPGGKTKDEPLSPSLVPHELGRMVFDVARDAGYSFIVVLDGLDILEATRAEAERFRTLRSQALNMAHGHDPIHFQLVAVTRTNTLREIWPDLDRHTPYTAGRDIAVELAAVDLDGILDKRISYLTRKVPQLAQEKGWLEKDWPGLLDDWPSILVRFREFMNEKDGELSRLDTMRTIYEKNKRAQVQGIQYAFSDFLRRGTPRPYRLIEALMKAGHCVPPRHYYYLSKGLLKWDRTKGTNDRFDNHLLPSVFVYPYMEASSGIQEVEAIPCRSSALLGVRVLQLLYAHEKRVATQTRKVSRLSLGEVKKICSKAFGYTEHVVGLAIEEYEQFELVELISPNFAVLDSADQLEVALMPKGRQTLEHFIRDVTYLNLSAMRVPLRPEVLRGVTEPFFTAATFETRSQEVRTTLEIRPVFLKWISAKITNSVALVRLLSALNEEQREAFDSNCSTIEKEIGDRLSRTLRVAIDGDDRVAGIFGIMQSISSGVPNQLHLVWLSLDEADRQECMRAIRAYSKRWEIPLSGMGET
jgi:hypothetical protein